MVFEDAKIKKLCCWHFLSCSPKKETADRFYFTPMNKSLLLVYSQTPRMFLLLLSQVSGQYSCLKCHIKWGRHIATSVFFYKDQSQKKFKSVLQTALKLWNFWGFQTSLKVANMASFEGMEMEFVSKILADFRLII